MKETTIEFPSRGQTYLSEEYGVYQYDVYPRGSVLEGMERRTYLDCFATLEEAKAAYPNATVIEGSLYVGPPNLSHLPDREDW